MSNFWDIRFGDYIAWVIGVIAIIIAVAIFKRQEKINNKIEAIKNSAINLSLGRIRMSLELIINSFESNIEIAKIAIGDGEWKLNIAKHIMKNDMKFYSLAIERMDKESDFLKGKIESANHTQIEQALQLTKNFATDEIPYTEFGILQALDKWYQTGQGIISSINETKEMLDKLLE